MDRSFRGIWRAAPFVLAADALYFVYLVLTRLNYAQIDAAGHVAGALALRRHGVHAYVDTFFLGAVQNLFYPPLEDTLLAAASLIADPFVAYTGYVAFLVIGWFAAGWLLARRLESSFSRCFFLLAFVLLFHLEKPMLTAFRGLGAVDLLITGLASETLGGIFLLLLLTELLGRARASVIALLIGLIAVSHMVILGVAVVLALAFLTTEARRPVASGVSTGLAAAAFFWVPLVFHGAAIGRGTLEGHVPVGLFLVGLWVFSLVRDGRGRAIAGSAAGLMLLVLAGSTFEPALGWLPRPDFNYLRFALPSLLLLALAIGLALDHLQRESSRATFVRGVVLVVAVVVVSVRVFDLARWSTDDPRLTPASVVDRSERGSRTWIIEPNRPADFAVASVLSVRDPSFRSAAGLYWESTSDNSLLNSYVATVLRPPVVMNYFHFSDYDCPLRVCMFEHLVRDYDIDTIAYDVDRSPIYLAEEEHTCLADMARSGKMRTRTLRPAGEIETQGRTLEVFRLDGHRTAEVIHRSRLRVIKSTETLPRYRRYIEAAFFSCKRDRELDDVYLDPAEHSRLLAALADVQTTTTATVTVVEDSGHLLELQVEASAPVVLRIKRSLLPGLRMFDDVKEVPLYHGYPHTIAVARGRLRLEHHRTAAMWTGYAVSLLTLLIVIVTAAYRRTRPPRRSGRASV